MKDAEREILLSFWKVLILHHASEEPIHGQWILTELRHHGYAISPGTLVPLLARMERRRWLKGTSDPQGGPRARRDCRLTAKGQSVLDLVRARMRELFDEVVAEAERGKQ